MLYPVTVNTCARHAHLSEEHMFARDRRVFNRSLQGSADMSLSYVVYTTSGDFHFYLAGFPSRTPFTFDIEEAQHFDTHGHAYEAAVHVERDFHRPTHIAPIERRTYGRR
jgi:hypothetical protein